MEEHERHGKKQENKANNWHSSCGTCTWGQAAVLRCTLAEMLTNRQQGGAAIKSA